MAADPLEGFHWPTEAVTYSIAAVDYPSQPAQFSSFITDAGTLAIVQSAAAMWSAISGVTLELVPDSAASDIRIGWENLNTPSTGYIGYTNWFDAGSNFDAGVTVAAEDKASSPIETLASGDEQYTAYTARLMQIFEHEIGHALGLDHNPGDVNALMNPYLSVTNRGPDQSDLLAIQSLYGPPAAPIAFALSGVATAITTATALTPFAGLSVADFQGDYDSLVVKLTGSGTLVDPSNPTVDVAVSADGKSISEDGSNVGGHLFAADVLNRLEYVPDAGVAPDATLTVTLQNSLGMTATLSTTITAPPVGLPKDLAQIVDVTTGQTSNQLPTAYSGPVAGLTDQWIVPAAQISDWINVTPTGSSNWFIHTGSGNDAVNLGDNAGSREVVDGGTGSNFLTAGSSGNDTFFVDARAATVDVWSTVLMHAGDDATMFGVTAASWFNGLGAAGYTGLTAVGNDGHAAALTLTGYSTADLSNGRLSVSFGTETDGSTFMHVVANG